MTRVWILVAALGLAGPAAAAEAMVAVAANFIARILDRHHWVAWIGFAIILYVAGDMIWDGSREVVAATRKA